MERRDYFERDPRLDFTDTVEGVEVRYRADVRRVSRGVLAVRLRPQDRAAAIHISQGDRSYDYDDARRRMAELVAPWVNVDVLETVDVRPAVAALHRLEAAARVGGPPAPTRAHRLGLRLPSGAQIALTSPAADRAMVGDAVIDETVGRARNAGGTGQVGNVYFTAGDANPVEEGSTSSWRRPSRASTFAIRARSRWLPTSSTPFADFAERLSGALRAPAQALAALLDTMVVPARLDPQELGSSIGAEPYDVAKILATAADEGLLRSGEHVRCSRCGTPMRVEMWRGQIEREGEARCSVDDAVIGEDTEPLRLWEITSEPLAVIQGRMANPRSALVMCALDLEREAVVAHLRSAMFERRAEARHAVGWLAGDRKQWRVEVGVAGALVQRAAAVTAAAVAAARPEVAMFVGIAGARKDLARGDVAVGDTVVDVSPG